MELWSRWPVPLINSEWEILPCRAAEQQTLIPWERSVRSAILRARNSLLHPSGDNMALVNPRKMLTIEMAEDYTGYPAALIRSAVRRGELKAERPSGFERGRLYFKTTELDRWLEAIAVDA